MRKQLTTVQQNKRNRVIKRIIYGIILAIAIPAIYIYCSNAVNDFFESLNTNISISTTKTPNKKHITKIDNTNNDKETNVTSKENDENIVLNNNHKDTSIISEKKDIEETTNNSTTTIKNNDDNNDNIEDRYSSFEPSISTDNVESSDKIDSNEKTNTTLSIPKEIEDEYLANKSNISQSTLEEINKNNAEIAKIEQQREELNAIKAKHDAKVSVIEAWYNEEFNKNYELMMEAKNTYEDLGGYATEDDKVQAYKDIKSAGVEALNNGFYGSSNIEELEKKYELVCKRYAYSMKYDEYYKYIYTTLPANKTEKLNIVAQEYNEDLKEFEEKYGL